jgi:antibiotic biosynthesis monooxygenase (ABM) superfamily enzyme
MPPNPPEQIDWVILQRFASSETAVAWLHSPRRLDFLKIAMPMLVGQDDIHIVKDGDAGVLPSPVSAVISTRVKPGGEAAFRAWEQKIAVAQSKAKGFQGYRFDPPIPGVQDNWLAIVRFDSDANMQAWMSSPERSALLKEAEAFTEEFHARLVRTGFDQWFKVADGGSPPAGWKQNMVVLLMLYPVVFLITAWFEHPLLVGSLNMPHWSALFVDNTVGVLVLAAVVPWASRRLAWWLGSTGRDIKTDVAGAALLVALYALLLLLFWQYEAHVWRPW